jgi:hypothetical protein
MLPYLFIIHDVKTSSKWFHIFMGSLVFLLSEIKWQSNVQIVYICSFGIEGDYFIISIY